MYTENYITESLELHLFFGRIMKEHSLFLKAGFTPVNFNCSAKAEFYKNEFEKLLSRAVTLSSGKTSRKVLDSGEIVTEFTLAAERQTEKLTGIPINSSITRRELNLRNSDCRDVADISRQVKVLNRTALRLLDLSETELINSADGFASDYSVLLNCCNNAQNRTLNIDSMAETKKFRDFKAAGAKGIENCKIRSLILPLLADHVLREANHYIRIMES